MTSPCLGGTASETSSGRNQPLRPSCRSSRTLPTRELLSTDGRAACDKMPSLLAPNRSVCPWSNGSFVSTMSTRPTSHGRCLSAFKLCSWTTMPSTTATKREACHGQELLCCMGWSTVAPVDTNWSCSTREAHATSATRLAPEIPRARLSTYSRR